MKKLGIALEPTDRGDLMCIACGKMHPHCDFEIVTRAHAEPQAGVHKKCLDSVRVKRGDKQPTKKRAVFTVPAEKVSAKTLRAVDYVLMGDPIDMYTESKPIAPITEKDFEIPEGIPFADEYLSGIMEKVPCEPPSGGATDSVEPSLGGAGNTSSRD